MPTASTGQQSDERTDRETTTGVPRVPPLGALGEVPWHELRDSSGSAAAVPLLLNSIAWGATDTAHSALDELRGRVCQYGFVTEQATAATVPFLWELARIPQVACRPGILGLLRNIADARQWEHTAAAYPKLLNHRENHVVWERAARDAVHAGRGALAALRCDPDPEVVRAAGELALALGD
ncbi:hypothetical protein [Streptomyces sp. NPDC006610]|jgi:hypothetical protein|uniref:hypothetical protein n=1 Tax=Streptomyces sp. NPDC006610 TaxID=3154584 RepID=UPI0033B45F81